ncbi:hypothetical protein DFR52_102925 [Hoeflea marina]|uniref:Oxidoreductase molybdopterin-binding domain-containing protein n=1 Tax=Hoeflea marina TaxID=274592 RepID=A0A317PNB6_9HYPH|nr:molybdopterin-dependent oxidoreductase [Hoeflea marina]PWW02257.1 hypothetical protein DFR52_102925 [Hoeflea marina]
MRTILLSMVLAAVVAVGPVPAAADDAGKIILTIDGEVASGAAVDFTLAELEALGTSTITTHTPWHDGAVTFEGVPLSVLMAKVGATGETAAMLALNNYRSEAPLSDFTRFGVILATRQNGKPMPVNDKGPLFVVYPFDGDPELKSEVYYSRSAWQVRSITIE